MNKADLTPAISGESGNQLECFYGSCHNPAWVEFALMGYKENQMCQFVFCCVEHQAAQLREWGEL